VIFKKSLSTKPTRPNISKLHSFLGFIGYYCKFVCNYNILARPLTNLLRRGQFGGSKEAESAFQDLQQTMTSTPTLVMPNLMSLSLLNLMLHGMELVLF